jgi:hypothetical protein
MSNLNETVEKIKRKWENTPNAYLLNDIEKCIQGGATGTEVIGRLGFFF